MSLIHHSFVVKRTGPLALFQDRGRFGFAGSGVSTSGAFDRLSAARANHAVGNVAHAAVIEILLGGFQLTAAAHTMIVFTGTDAAVRIERGDGTVMNSATNVVIDVSPGDTIRLEQPSYGMRAYLAVRGGFRVAPVLGSASHDVLSAIGPAPLAEGDELFVGDAVDDPAWWPQLRQLPALWRPMAEETLTAIPGPRADWFSKATLDQFFQQPFQVTADSNRIGLRLETEHPLQRERSGELASEGMVRGSIQVPPNGQPVIFGPDHPVTGGYPVIAVLTARSCDRSAQLLPGDTVRFRRA